MLIVLPSMPITCCRATGGIIATRTSHAVNSAAVVVHHDPVPGVGPYSFFLVFRV